jgi:hypothetical protein
MVLLSRAGTAARREEPIHPPLSAIKEDRLSGSMTGAGVTSEASVARSAIELALVERGYLQYRRRSIPPPIKRK